MKRSRHHHLLAETVRNALPAGVGETSKSILRKLFLFPPLCCAVNLIKREGLLRRATKFLVPFMSEQPHRRDQSHPPWGLDMCFLFTQSVIWLVVWQHQSFWPLLLWSAWDQIHFTNLVQDGNVCHSCRSPIGVKWRLSESNACLQGQVAVINVGCREAP